LTAHFGLGDFSGTIDSVTIQWPSGILQQFADVTPNTLLLAQEASVGDFNGDLSVNEGDLLNWQTEYGLSSGPLTADADADGDVDGRDFLFWQTMFGAPLLPPLSAVAAVPEPNTGVFPLLFAVALLGSRGFPRNKGNIYVLLFRPTRTMRLSGI
jgi:hypothetical protein